MEAWKDSRIEGWKDGSAGGMEGWDGPSRPPYIRATPLLVTRTYVIRRRGH